MTWLKKLPTLLNQGIAQRKSSTRFGPLHGHSLLCPVPCSHLRGLSHPTPAFHGFEFRTPDLQNTIPTPSRDRTGPSWSLIGVRLSLLPCNPAWRTQAVPPRSTSLTHLMHVVSLVFGAFCSLPLEFLLRWDPWFFHSSPYFSPGDLSRAPAALLHPIAEPVVLPCSSPNSQTPLQRGAPFMLMGGWRLEGGRCFPISKQWVQVGMFR